MKKIQYLIAVVAVAFMVTACNSPSEESKKGGETASREQQQVQTGFNKLSQSQQVPTFDWSQERQSLIDLETIRATGAIGTTAGYLEGIGMVWWCPSVGGPVPSSYQLSGSTQWVDLPGDESRELYAIDQGEPTGVYVGESTGTWTICVDDNGTKFAKYFEGYTDSTIAVIDYYDPELRVRPSDVTFEFTEEGE